VSPQKARSESVREGAGSEMRLALCDLSSLEGVQVVILASRDGLIVSSSGDMGEVDELRAALMAAIFGTVGRAVAPLSLGLPTDAIIETDTHCLQITSLDDFLLATVTGKGANVGLVRLRMRQTARRIQRSLAGQSENGEAALGGEAVAPSGPSSVWQNLA
jgi:predicted regulator of Ras-like GTPase activity (Roadblock/LC7/MglB family)